MEQEPAAKRDDVAATEEQQRGGDGIADMEAGCSNAAGLEDKDACEKEAAEEGEAQAGGEAASAAAAEGGAVASTSGAAPAAAGPPLSKNQMKKRARLERMNEFKAERRQAERAAKKQKKEEKRAETTQAMEAMTEEERKQLKKQLTESRKERATSNQDRRARLQRCVKEGLPLVIDLDFDGMMNENELRHLCQQLSYSYAANAKVAAPCHLHLTGWKGALKAMAEKQISGLSNWFLTKTPDSYLTHFADRKDKLVYLTADSATEIEDVDPDSIYIIGGIVDHNRFKGLCLKRAEEAGIATARLPIKKYVALDSRAVLTVNHVVQIMVEMHNRHDWQGVLDEVIPPRKRTDFNKGKKSEDGGPGTTSGGRSEDGTTGGDGGATSGVGEDGGVGGEDGGDKAGPSAEQAAGGETGEKGGVEKAEEMAAT